MSFLAKWPGECADCGDTFISGTELMYDMDHNIVHCPTCPDVALIRKALREQPACPKCYLIHKGECL